MVISEQLVEKVDGFGAHQVLILGVHESLPSLFGVSAEDVVEARVQLDVILFNVLE